MVLKNAKFWLSTPDFEKENLKFVFTGCGRFPRQLTQHTNGVPESVINVSKPENILERHYEPFLKAIFFSKIFFSENSVFMYG